MEAGANPVDIHVGALVRAKRRGLGISQEKLGAMLGLHGADSVSFQQVQKYERGANRLSASSLYAVAAALGCTVGDLFEGLPEAPRREPPAEQARRLFSLSAEGTEVCGLMAALPPRLQDAVIFSARALLEAYTAAKLDKRAAS